jgi:hypothetical protein
MEQATDPKPPPGTARRPRGDTRSKLSIDEERIVKVAPPPGSRFKGTTSFLVQDLVICRHVVDFRRELRRAINLMEALRRSIAEDKNAETRRPAPARKRA